MKRIVLLLLLSLNSSASINFEDFIDLKDALYRAFDELKPNSEHTLTVNNTYNLPEDYWWSLDVVHASYSRQGNSHNIFLFGGFARLSEMSLDGLAITACHEIGHGIGKAPFKDSGSSTEGQADYFATKICLPIVFKYLAQTVEVSKSKFNLNFCRESENNHYCLRALTALESNIFFFKTLGDTVHFSTRSTEVARELNTSPTFYPSSQCRLDTSLNGVLKKPRPACWYPMVLN
ncbi:ImmA/IrrE family metallo-endopeptidase [Halobacteriovorax sp.]|uniref:ImmA/IrrE family metallo-endopeptidase n=1 Tax=Halobacteriovorax sp. TaxID=2020862 RepID=UPI00356A44A9